MRMRVVGVPVVNGDPLQPGPQVLFQAAHQPPGVAAQVAELGGVLRRHDDPELVAIPRTGGNELGGISDLGLGSIGPARLTVPADAGPLPIAQVGPAGLEARRPEPHQSDFDDHPALSDPGSGPG